MQNLPSPILFELLLDHLDIGVFILDKNGRYLYVNEAYTKINGHTREFFLSRNIRFAKEEYNISHLLYEDILEKKQTLNAIMVLTNKHQSQIKHLLTLGVPLLDKDGEVEYILYLQEPVSSISKRIQLGIINQSCYQMLDSAQGSGHVDIIAKSPQMSVLLETLSNAAKTDASVLINGASGSGKEVLAHFVHENSNRSNKPFVILNCAEIPENLLESELFGYESGAFTGASSSGKPGLIEASHGGTLFIDEINSMPLSTQAKLLRVLETHKITHIGSVNPKEIDFRLICASNENLSQLIEDKLFRADLFYRINVVSVSILPLCERKEDILPLISYFLSFFCEKYSCLKAISQQALNCLLNYSWPGNVRELRNIIERMIVISPKDEWEITQVPSEILDRALITTDYSSKDDASFSFKEGLSFKDYVNNYEKQLLIRALKEYGTPARAAKELKMDLSNVYRKMQKYSITNDRARP